MPQDGVAAAAEPAVTAPATPTPPTRVSVAAVASTLLLMDIRNYSFLGTRSRALRAAAFKAGLPRRTRPDGFRSARHAAGHGLDQATNGLA